MLPIENSRLVDGVQIWIWNLDETTHEVARRAEQLSDDDLEYARQLRNPVAMRRFITSRTLVQHLIAERLGLQGPIDFQRDRLGKPSSPLPLADGSQPLYFNLCYAENLALFAISEVGPVGVGIEAVRAQLDVLDLAKCHFTQQEFDRLRTLRPALAALAFCKCWTIKEAFLKSKGRGLSDGMNELLALADTRGEIAIQFETAERRDAVQCYQRTLTAGDATVVAAVCCRTKPHPSLGPHCHAPWSELPILQKLPVS